MANFQQPTTGRAIRSSRKQTFTFDQTTVIGILTLSLLIYIVYHFFYPLITKGLLF
jgi:hypothetical protein